MVEVKIDMTGWKMWEHGVSDSRLTVLEQVEDYVGSDGKHIAQWLCECNCDEHKRIIVRGTSIRNGNTLSCGCKQTEFVSKHNSITRKKYNKYHIIDDIVYIYFRNSNEFTYVDLDKWNTIPYIREFCWYKDNEGYARAKIPTHLKSRFDNKVVILLHQLICPCQDGYEPDHIDRNRLNNTIANLTPKTHAGNMQNQSKRIDNTSGIVGVNWNKSNNAWCVRIGVNGKRIHIGYFYDKNEAIKSRLCAEVKYYGTKHAPQRHLFKKYGITLQNDYEVTE